MKLQPIPLVDQPTASRRDFLQPIYQNAIGTDVLCPFIVLRGAADGPVLGVSAAIHGNELNGIRIIHRLLDTINPKHLSGTILFAPVANVPAFEAGQRRFPEDEKDLNTVFPGKREGTPSQQYALNLKQLFLPKLDYLVDFHTASEGRTNTMYVRVDWQDEDSRRLAEVMQPEIILHGRSGDGTLRNAARKLGIHAITVEAGNPSVFQGRMVTEGEIGLLRVLDSIGMLHDDVPPPLKREPIVCTTSTWLRTTAGGIMDLDFKLGERIAKGQVLARLHDAFGKQIASYHAHKEGVVIGMMAAPVAVPGTRFCHLGTMGIPKAVAPPSAS